MPQAQITDAKVWCELTGFASRTSRHREVRRHEAFLWAKVRTREACALARPSRQNLVRSSNSTSLRERGIIPVSCRETRVRVVRAAGDNMFVDTTTSPVARLIPTLRAMTSHIGCARIAHYFLTCAGVTSMTRRRDVRELGFGSAATVFSPLRCSNPRSLRRNSGASS